MTVTTMSKSINSTPNFALCTSCIVLFACLLMLNACGGQATNTSTKGIAKIYCEESFRNILDQEVEVFEYSYPDASIMVNYAGDNACIDSLMHRAADLVITTRDITPEQHEILAKQGRAHRSRAIAVDAVAIIVNNANDIEELSEDDLREIFDGRAKRWGDVFPTTLKRDSISVVLDGSGTGVMNFVKERYVPQGGKFAANVYAQRSTEDVFRAVQTRKNAIGFVGVSWINASLDSNATTIEQRVSSLINDDAPSAIDFTNRIKVMPLRGDSSVVARKPYQAYIFNGEYPLTRKVYAIDASAGGTLDHGFYSFLTGVVGQKIILQTGIVPAAEPVRLVEAVK